MSSIKLHINKTHWANNQFSIWKGSVAHIKPAYNQTTTVNLLAEFTDKFGCVPDLSYFEMPRLIFVGVIRAHIKCPGERQFRRTLDSMEKPVQNEKRKKGEKSQKAKTKSPNRANNPQPDPWKQNEDVPLRGSLNKRSSLTMFNSILPHFIHFPTSLTSRGPTRGIPFFFFFFLEVYVERICIAKREGTDNTQESCETGGLVQAAA